MIRRVSLVASLTLFAFVASMVVAEEAKKEKEIKCKCVVAKDKDAKESNSVEYRGAKVYFCCGNCPKEFGKNKDKYTTRANAQLVVTGQAKQEKCPLSGQELNADTKIKVGGTEVAFCCNMCKGKVEKATGDDQLALVFADKAFDKGFKVEKAK